SELGQYRSAARLRVVLAKVGLDGHDRGIKVVARALRDAGLHVIYAGLWQTPEAVVRAVADEDADWLGLSLLSGAHMTLVPRVLELLRQAGLEHVGGLVGGIVPPGDRPKRREGGVARVFGPGPPLAEIIGSLHEPSKACPQPARPPRGDRGRGARHRDGQPAVSIGRARRPFRRAGPPSPSRVFAHS